MSRTSGRPVIASSLAVTIALLCWWWLRAGSTEAPQSPSGDAAATSPPDVARPPRRAPSAPVEVVPAAEQVVAAESTSAIVGVALDRPGGSGVAGARVEVIERDLATGAKRRIADAAAGADGTFRIDGIPGGRTIFVSATAPHRVRAEVELDPAYAPVELVLSPAGVLRGIVRDARAAPVAGAWVHLHCLGAPEPRNATTGEDGRFEVDGLPLPTRWSAYASRTGHVAAYAGQSVLLDDAHRDGTFEIALGVVAKIDVRVLNSDGSPAAGARIQYGNGHSGHMVRTDGDGLKTLEIKEPGTWSVLVDSSSTIAHAAVVEAVAGETREVVVRLDEGVALSGVVVDDSGTPVAGARVFSPDEPAGEPNDGTRSIDAKSDGSFRLTGLGTGEHLIAAVAPGCGRGETTATAPAADVRIVVARGGRMTMRLVPSPGAAVPERRSYRLTQTGASRRGDPSGAWPLTQIEERLGPGAWDLDVAAEGYAPSHRTFQIRRGEVTALGEIALVPGLALTGRVVDVQGKAVAGAAIRHAPSSHVQADGAGRFAFRDSPRVPCG